MMECSVCLLFTLLNIFLAAFLASGQDQSGFISLDCGSPPNKNYTEEQTGINYISDANFIDTGVERSIKPEYQSRFQKHVWNLRSFPEGSRNCYTVNVTEGDKYLIRATFLYGNYDDRNATLKFDLHLGPNFWTSVDILTEDFDYYYEMIHVSKADHLQVCLVKNGNSTPFISALELRKLPAKAYEPQNGTLQTVRRYDITCSTSNGPYRYGIDEFDRIWQPYNVGNCEPISTSKYVAIDNGYYLPEIAMKTAAAPSSQYVPMRIPFTAGLTGTVELFVVLHIAEIQVLKSSETREFIVLYNGKQMGQPDRPYKFSTTSRFLSISSAGPNANGNYEISLQRTGASTLPPLLNALELYKVNFLTQAETDKKEVEAMLNIKSGYDLNITSWQGDPCAPQDYRWERLNCSDTDPPKITSLDLSSIGLNGTIPKSISDLTNLESLDLSNNSLTGSIPEFLAEMETLKVLNLSANKFRGSVPAGLLDKRTKGSIKLSIEENPGLCASASCAKKKKTVTAIVVASAVLFLLLVGASITLLILKIRRSSARARIEKNRRLTYCEVLRIRNRHEVLGRGGFGVVYYGKWGNEPVAVKMLNQSTAQVYKQFKEEVKILLRVHHKNLTRLCGYCDNKKKLSLIYEYMAKGDLKKHLSGEPVLSWEERLQIAIDSAEGLKYLHEHSQPQIIHRDVKTTNILLNDALQAKLADFGLSRSFPDGNETNLSNRNVAGKKTHLSSRNVAGTPGYLDPEYQETGNFSTRSDVYSFGVVLLEIITSKPVIDTRRKPQHIGEWVNSMLKEGDISTIVDPKLQGNFDAGSVKEVVHLAEACLNESSAQRPTMTEVVQRLKESLKLDEERIQRNSKQEITNDPPK